MLSNKLDYASGRWHGAVVGRIAVCRCGKTGIDIWTRSTLGSKSVDVSSTSDKLFLLSTAEIRNSKFYGVNQMEDYQYEFYAGKGVTGTNYSGASNGWGHCAGSPWITIYGEDTQRFLGVDYDGSTEAYAANDKINTYIAFCF